MADTVEALVVVAGRVQGVYFRASTVDAALAAGVTGYVRNLPDGRVEALVQGERDRVEKVIAFMRQGPPGAFVTDVTIDRRVPTERYDGFRVRR